MPVHARRNTELQDALSSSPAQSCIDTSTTATRFAPLSASSQWLRSSILSYCSSPNTLTPTPSILPKNLPSPPPPTDRSTDQPINQPPTQPQTPHPPTPPAKQPLHRLSGSRKPMTAHTHIPPAAAGRGMGCSAVVWEGLLHSRAPARSTRLGAVLVSGRFVRDGSFGLLLPACLPACLLACLLACVSACFVVLVTAHRDHLGATVTMLIFSFFFSTEYSLLPCFCVICLFLVAVLVARIFFGVSSMLAFRSPVDALLLLCFEQVFYARDLLTSLFVIRLVPSISEGCGRLPCQIVRAYR